MVYVILISVVLYVYLKNKGYKDSNQDLISRILKLEKRIQGLEQKVNTSEPAIQPETPKVESQQVILKINETPLSNIKPLEITTENSQATPQPVNTFRAYTEKINTPPAKTSEFWTKIEKQFVENWTGILGAVIMVVGVGFLGVYAALKLSAFNRFLLICTFSGVLMGLFFYLRAKTEWLKFALWLRSSAGAVFLFACLGSAGIPGLQWIDEPIYGLIILVIGIMVNLFLGYLGGSQAFASLHVLLSLVALSIAPQSAVTLVIAALVSLFGIGLTFKEKWDYHLLLTISSFFAYHLYWYYQQTGLTFNSKVLGIITVLTVSLTVALVHYRNVYKTKTFDTLPFSVHLINWLYFGIGLFLHSTGTQLSTFFIAGGSIAAFFLARRAKKLEIRWLYNTDTLMAQLAAIIAITTLYKWHLDELIIVAGIFIEIMVFLVIMQKEAEEFLCKVGTVLLNIAGFILIIFGLKMIDFTDNSTVYSHSATLFACFSLGTIFHLYNLKKNKFDFTSLYRSFDIHINPKVQAPVFGIILGFIFICVYGNLYKTQWSEYFIVFSASILIYIRNKYQSTELALTSFIVLIGAHLINWYQLSHNAQISGINTFIHCSPLLILSAATIKWSYIEYLNKYINWLGIYFVAIHTIIISYFIFNPISPLIPAVVWLSLSLVALELSQFAKKFSNEIPYKNQTDRFLLHVGYTLILAFLVRHIMVHLQSEQYIGGFIKIRLLIEIFALGIFAYWGTSKKSIELKYRSWIYLHPLFLELIMLFSILMISLEVSAIWQPIIWISSAFLFAFIGNLKREHFSRLLFYSLIMYWVTAFQDSFITSSYVTPSSYWYDQAWLGGSIAIALQFLFLIYFYKNCSLENINLPKALSFLQNPINTVSKSRNVWIFYPLLICTAIFLFSSFDKSILTLLWVMECFMVFILSVILKEKYFRYVALSALMLCIIRLIFYDLAQTSTLTRALVFFGVGIIMLVMNSIYNKYKDRFVNEKIA